MEYVSLPFEREGIEPMCCDENVNCGCFNGQECNPNGNCGSCI